MFTLTYPTVAPTLTVAIRNPIFGDILRVDTQAIIRDTRSGELKGFKDSSWPNIEVNVYQFTTLTRAKMAEIRSFLLQTAGLQLAINTDHLGQTWFGYIISPVNDIVTQQDDCSYDISFEFQGVKQ